MSRSHAEPLLTPYRAPPVGRDLYNNGDSKRFKPSPPVQEQPFIDLTNDSDDFEEILSDTDDSSDEGDVMITGVRDLSRSNTTENVKSALDQKFKPKAENNRLQSLNVPESITKNATLPKPLKNGPPSLLPNTPSASANLNSTSNHIQPQTTEQNLNNTPLTSKAVKVNGIVYRSEADVNNKEKMLKNAVTLAKKKLSDFEQDSKKHTELLTRILSSIDRLKALKVSETTPEYRDLVSSKSALMSKAKEDAKSKTIYDARVKSSTTELLGFINHARPKILSTLNSLRLQEAREQEEKRRRLEMQRHQEQQRLLARQQQQQQQQRQPNSLLDNIRANIFGDMLQNLNPNRPMMGDDEEDSEEEIYNMLNRRNYINDNQESQHGMNVYNSGTTEDLRSFLESIKTIEDSIEGESNTPEDLTVNLLKHQRLGLHWLELNENDEKKKGGILADAMGLGKTVQAISLMLSRRSKDDDLKTNLIVCPVAMMRQWESEIETKVKESADMKVFLYTSTNGKARLQTFKQLAKFDVVIVSFQTLASEMKKHIHGYDLGEMGIRRINELKARNSYISPFFAKESKFYRTILDEAHFIKNKLTKASLACHILESEYRWCLSGTPMQNNIDEIFPLIRFLRIKPYCFEDKFRTDISIPLKPKNENYDEMDRQKAMQRVRIMLKALLLKRSKDSKIDGEPILKLPEKSVVVEDVIMEPTDPENIFYRHLEGKSAIQVEKMLQKGLAKGNYSSILTLLLRLRQACLHSELVRIGERKQGFTFDGDGNLRKKATWDSMYQFASDLKPEVVRRINSAEAQQDGGGDGDDSSDKFTCPICIDSITDQDWCIFYPCGHGLCTECVDNFFETFQEGESNNGIRVAKCTQCRLQVKETHMITYPIFDNVCNKKLSKAAVGLLYEKNTKELAKINKEIDSELVGLKLSPKLERALELIKKIQSNDSSEKIILFSQFTTLFDVFQKFLNKENIESLRYDGSMTSDARNDVIKEFYKNPSKNLLLISLKAGNVGLTLTCANHVIIMDPFWNPYVEEQAQDRAHRIGQQKPVTIYRLLVGGTVEDRIMELQRKKKELVESALDEKGIKSVGGLGRNEIEFLFNLRARPE